MEQVHIAGDVTGSPKCVFCAQNYRGKVGVEREEGKVVLEKRREEK